VLVTSASTWGAICEAASPTSAFVNKMGRVVRLSLADEARRPPGYLPMLYLIVWVIREDYEMRFNGCTCKACQAAAVGVVLFAATPHHDQFCEQQHKPTYCNLAWDLPHGPHNDQGSINTVRSQLLVSSSTSSISAMLNPDFFIKPPG